MILMEFAFILCNLGMFFQYAGDRFKPGQVFDRVLL
jgi:hypothetical protein